MNFDDFNALSRPSSPNTYLVAPEGFCANAVPDRTSEAYETAPEALFQRIVDMIGTETGWELTGSDSQIGAVSFVSTSKLMRYKDDIDVLVVPLEEGEPGCKLAIYSRSRVGYSDMGANRKRVLDLLERLKDRQKQL